MKNTFDYIIAGGGCAGLSLAYSLINSPLKHKSILIVDLEKNKSNDRTWCYWTSESSPFASVVFRNWSEIAFADDNGERVESIAPYRYEMVRSIDFYNHIWQDLSKFPNVQFLQGRISEIHASEEKAYVDVEGQRYTADWVFDSCFNLSKIQSLAKQSHYFQVQHFLGWVIKTEEEKFDPNQAMLMDFRTEQHEQARFFYILPYSTTEALVEYTIFSSELINKNAYEKAIEAYLKQQLKIDSYQITEEEYGIIPMTNVPFPKRENNRIVQIGISGSAAKPTTGYAFLKIQEQVRSIVQQLTAKTNAVHLKPTQKRFAFYDTLLLYILQEDGGKAKSIFSKLFRKNRFKTILKFLNERSNLWEEARIFSSLPKVPFLNALYQAYFKRKNERSTSEVLSSQNQRV